jgi:hypothetical protein
MHGRLSPLTFEFIFIKGRGLSPPGKLGESSLDIFRRI